MKNISILLTGWMLLLSSCDYLDIVPDNVATIDNAFTMRSTAEKYLFTCYSYLPEEGNPRNNPAFVAGDEFWFHYPTTLSGWPIARNNQNVVNPAMNFWDGTEGGMPLFRAIRDCNIFLENIGKVPDIEETERNRWIGEVKFLKAYFHFYLLRMYGPIPLVRENLPISAGVQEVQVERRPADECFGYIVELLDEAAPHLPEVIARASSEAGRITLPIAVAMKARVLLLAASPLFNGNADYEGFTNKDGTPLFSTVYDAQKWERAKTACREAIDLCHQLGHELYYHTQSAVQYPGLSDITKTKLNIRNSFTEKWNREIIWGNTTAMGLSIQADAMPRGLDPSKLNSGATRGFLAPTLKIAEMFYTENGLPINEDITWDYEGRYNSKTATIDDKYYLKPNYETVAFNFDREPRFYADLGFDGVAWFGNGRIDDNNPWYMEAKKGQPQAMINVTMYSVTGYWPKKLVNIHSAFSGSNSIAWTAYPWPMIRLADLYLMYAEATNEYDGPNDDVYYYLNAIRSRAGIPTVEDAWSNYSLEPSKYTTKEGLREIIHRERLIELAFEGHRYWDLRRWKKAAPVISGPVKAWNISQSDAPSYHQEQVLFNQQFNSRDYFWPIRELETIVNKKLVQNPGW
jgi:hypothetical protein